VATVEAQKPFAVVLACSDSRVAPEIIFNQNLADIFVIRTAGHTVDAAVKGSVEYAVKHLNVPLVAVVGHSGCGAVSAAVKGGKHPENLRYIIDNITAVVKNCANIDEAVCENVRYTVSLIEENDVVKECGAVVIGACYFLETGAVSFFDVK
jgi:carbonic anhydrase